LGMTPNCLNLLNFEQAINWRCMERIPGKKSSFRIYRCSFSSIFRAGTI
jgi:hypothetical protein